VLSTSDADTASSVSFTVYGKASPAGSKAIRYTKEKRPYITDVTGDDGKRWRANVAQMAGIVMMGTELFEGPVRLSLMFVIPRPKGHYRSGRFAGELRQNVPRFPTKKPDLTKLVRGVEDALTGIVWRDDSQVVEQFNRKIWGEPAHVVITVERI